MQSKINAACTDIHSDTLHKLQPGTGKQLHTCICNFKIVQQWPKFPLINNTFRMFLLYYFSNCSHFFFAELGRKVYTSFLVLTKLQIYYCSKYFQMSFVYSVTTRRILRLPTEEYTHSYHPIWMVAVNMLNKQSRTADKGWSPSFGVGQGADNYSP